jgi:hypothetical protein
MKFVYLDKIGSRMVPPQRSVAVAIGVAAFLLSLRHDAVVGRFILEPTNVLRCAGSGIVTDVYADEGKQFSQGLYSSLA